MVTLADALRKQEGPIAAAQLQALPASGGPAPVGDAAVERWRFLTRLALRLGWLRCDRERLAPTERLESALSDPGRAWLRLWRAFLEGPRGRKGRGGEEAPGAAGPSATIQGRIADALPDLDAGWRPLASVAD